MDVQAATPTSSTTSYSLPAPPPLPAAVSGAAVQPGADAPASAIAPAASAPSIQSGTGSGAPADPTPGLALLPPPGATSGTAAERSSESLPNNVGKLYGAPADTTSVSFQPAAGSNEIVTVVTDTTTGKVVVQFPSETLVALAQFFQKLDNSAANSGAVVDKRA